MNRTTLTRDRAKADRTVRRMALPHLAHRQAILDARRDGFIDLAEHMENQ